MTDKEIVDQILIMCMEDQKRERKRSDELQNSKKGDRIANLQGSSISYGCSLQADKVVRFINSSRNKAQNDENNDSN